MRIPICASIAVIAIALGIGWRDHQRLAAARQDLASLVRETHGTTPSTASSSLDTRRTRVEIQRAAASLASEWMACLQKTDTASEAREGELWDLSRQLTVTGWESFISRVLDSTDASDSIRRELTSYAICELAKLDPHSAFKMIDRTSTFFAGDHRGRNLFDGAIYQLAKLDPLAAADRLRHPGENLAPLVTDQAGISLIIATAIKDPALAFRFLDDIEFQDRYRATWSLGESASTPEQKTALLAELRKQLPTITEPDKRGQISQTILSALANTFAYGNFSEARQWFDSAKLSPEELAICASQIQRSILRPETGLWIEWLGSKLSPEESRSITSSMMRSWIENDHKAATQWLSNNTSADPVKYVAIASYAEAFCKYKPEDATSWALKMPAGRDRDNVLRVIHSNWPPAKSAERDAFAKEHGFTWP